MFAPKTSETFPKVLCGGLRARHPGVYTQIELIEGEPETAVNTHLNLLDWTHELDQLFTEYDISGQHITIVRKSDWTGKLHKMTLPLTGTEFNIAYRNWQQQGQLIQRAFPTLDADQREFLMTGITNEEWEAAFGKDKS